MLDVTLITRSGHTVQLKQEVGHVVRANMVVTKDDQSMTVPLTHDEVLELIQAAQVHV